MRTSFSISLILVFLSVLGCSDWNSAIETSSNNGINVNQKPKCSFKVTSNCWVQSMEMLGSCLSDEIEETGVMSHDSYNCENGPNQLVNFINPNKLASNFAKGALDFRIYNKLKPCFRFSGDAENFIIDSAFGKLQVKSQSNGDTEIVCLSGEKLILSKTVKERGCRNQNVSIADFVPRAELVVAKDLTQVSYVFNFLGLGTGPKPLFNCSKSL